MVQWQHFRAGLLESLDSVHKQVLHDEAEITGI